VLRAQAAHLAFNQDLAGDAAVNTYFLLGLARNVEWYGEHGYRLAHTEVAIMAGWGYLAAYALGIGATGPPSSTKPSKILAASLTRG